MNPKKIINLPNALLALGGTAAGVFIHSGIKSSRLPVFKSQKEMEDAFTKKEPLIDPKVELRKAYLRKAIREKVPVTYISNVKEFPKGEFSKSELKELAEATQTGHNIYQVHRKGHDYIVGPPRINKNVFLHEVGHTLQTKPDELSGWPRIKGRLSHAFKPTKLERDAWEFAEKHTKLTDEDRKALNSYLQAEYGMKAFASGLVAYPLLYIGTKMKLEKNAGILDKPQDVLSPDIWLSAEDKTLPYLRPEIREQVLTNLYKFVPEASVKEVVILGSITGYKYTETSDIDVNALVDPYLDEYHSKRRAFNEIPAYGTRHPVNYMIQALPKRRKRNPWQDSFFGVYSVLKDTWISPPPPRKVFREPGHEYNLQLQIAKHIASNFERLLLAFRTDFKELIRLKNFAKFTYTSEKKLAIDRKEKELKEDIKELLELSHHIESQRKFEYRYGWGIPRKSFRNIVYKLVEHGPYGREFHILQRIKLGQKSIFGSRDMLRVTK